MVGSIDEMFPFVITTLFGLLCVVAVNVESWRPVAVRSVARPANWNVLSGFSRLVGSELDTDRLSPQRFQKPVNRLALPPIDGCRRRLS